LIFLPIPFLTSFLMLSGFLVFAGFEFKFQGEKVSPSKMFEDMNRAYNIVFPLLVLLVLCYKWPFGWIILFLHSFLLVPSYVWLVLVPFVKKAWFASYSFVMKDVRHWASFSINYPIYLGFRMVGVNLKKEGVSAIGFLKKKMGGR